MVYAIARERGIRMPHFFGYALWTAAVLMPLFELLTLLPISPNFEMELVDADTRIPRVDHCPLENNARDWSDARAVVSIREITHEQIPASLESMFDEIMERSAAGLTQAGDKPERQALPRPVAR